MLVIAMLTTNISVFAQDENIVAFVNVNVIPMDSERILEGYTVVVEDDRITAMGPANEVAIPDGAQVIEADGQYLIPGLTDNHSHPDGMPVALALYLANGVTTVRAFNATPEDFEKKAAIDSGDQVGSRLYVGPSVNGLPVSLVAPVDQLKHAVAPYFGIDLGPGTVTGCEDAREFVHTAYELGADFVKTNLGLPLESFDCIVATANELGIPVKGHISDEVRTEHYINSGAEVQHATELYPYLSQEVIHDLPARHEDDLLVVEQNLPILINMILDNNMPFGPTLITPEWSFDQYEDLEGTLQRPEYQYYSPQVMAMLSNPDTNVFFTIAGIGFADEAYRNKIRAFGLELTKALFDDGVMILAGTDSTIDGGPVYGFSLHDELQLFVDAGLTPYQALETTTRNSAIAMGELDEWGTIEAGKRADLVLLSANPLDDIANAEQIAGVMVQGQWLTADDLQQKLDDIVASYEVIELAPFANEDLGISGVVPSGWKELEPSVYARGNPEVDPTLFVQLSAPGESAESLALSVLANFGVSELPAEPMDSYESAALAWTLYQLESPMAPMALALAETDSAAYLVLIAAPGEEMDALAETLFFPAVDALTPIE
jgi:imidazolonepropionase-like amidohydrolase